MSDIRSERRIAVEMLPRIGLEHLNVHLSGQHVLRDVTWTLEAGQHWAIVGPNGSGKSTLLRVLAGTQWIDDDSGVRSYSPDGVRRDVVARAATWIRHVSAEQHERYARLDLALTGRAVVESGFTNETYVHHPPTAEQEARIDVIFDTFGLHAFATRAIRELSSGQIRRLLIARALMGEPKVMVLDEFTSGLDRMSRRDVVAFLERLASHVALVIASHRPDDFPAAITHTARLSDGRIVSVATGRSVDLRPTTTIRPSGQQPGEPAPILLSFRHADVYRGRNLVLKNVNWQLRRGEHTIIRGANGAGKTTFAGLIAGTIAPATGAQVVRFGATGPFDIWRLKERVAHVSDDLQITYDQAETVEAVVASGFPSSIGLFTQRTSVELAAVLDVLGRIGLRSLAGRTFTHLSFGERRKVLIARSLIRQPEIYVLDEIWNGLDSAFRAALTGILSDMVAAGTTIVAVAHDDDDVLASLAGRICFIANRTIHEERPARREIASQAGV